MSIIILGIILRGIILGIIVPQDNKKQKIKLDKPQAKIINTPEFIIYIP